MPRIALLVDDEQPMRTFVSAVLTQDGFQVFEAANGTEALSVIQQLNGFVDILITDIEMPRMTGVELVKAVKVDFPNIPVIYISGNLPSTDFTTRTPVCCSFKSRLDPRHFWMRCAPSLRPRVRRFRNRRAAAILWGQAFCLAAGLPRGAIYQTRKSLLKQKGFRSLTTAPISEPQPEGAVFLFGYGPA